MTRAQIVHELETLGTRRGPTRSAEVAAHWTRTASAPPDALIDVWVAVDDWVAAGRPDGYDARLVSALTVFDTYLRYGIR